MRANRLFPPIRPTAPPRCTPAGHGIELKSEWRSSREDLRSVFVGSARWSRSALSNLQNSPVDGCFGLFGATVPHILPRRRRSLQAQLHHGEPATSELDTPGSRRLTWQRSTTSHSRRMDGEPSTRCLPPATSRSVRATLSCGAPGARSAGLFGAALRLSRTLEADGREARLLKARLLKARISLAETPQPLRALLCSSPGFDVSPPALTPADADSLVSAARGPFT